MARLLTLVHVSDLHLGDLDPASDDAALEAKPPVWWPRLRIFDGYLGHGGTALKELHAFVHALRDSEGAHLVVTGDLTAVGSPTEFALARDYLTASVRAASGIPLGLAEARAFERAVPGNHDAWPGKRPSPRNPLPVWGNPTPGLHAAFPVVPRAPWRQRMANGQDLVVVGIDSGADVPAYGSLLPRLFARGSFHGQLDQVDAMLAHPATDEVRVLLLHHSPMHRRFRLGIDDRSRARLRRLVLEREVGVVLTGHVHQVPSGRVELVRNASGVAWNHLEARCGTTTQRTTLPPGWPRQQLDDNTLLVHRIEEQPDGTVTWSTRHAVRTALGFVEKGPLRCDGAFPDAGVQVWPRA